MMSNRSPWNRLPPEIQNEIIGLLPVLGGRRSLLATVCRVWQSIIEPLNFAEISLTIPRLADVNSQAIMFRRRSQIRYIWFRVELKQYDCGQCANTNEDNWGLDNVDNQSIADAFESLFTALSAWEPRGDLVLDISVYSPSDNKHWFKYLSFCSDSPSYWSRRGQEQDNTTTLIDDPAHGWIAGLKVFAPDEQAIEKTFDEIMGEGPFDDEEPEMEWWRRLPLVPVVGVVLLRKQTRRRWKPVALANMLTRFPNMNELCYEPWREWTGIEMQTDRRSQTLIESFPLTKLSKLTIFENFNESYPERYFECPAIRVSNPAVSRKLARVSLDLTTLSASFMVDANDFFAPRQASWTWEKLTSLALTSKLLTDDANNLDINNMLRRAAAAAMQMPRLGTMELWNGRRGVAMLFRYQKARDGQSAIITIRGTAELALGIETMRAWEAVAQRPSHGNGSVVVQTCTIDPDAVRCHGDAIRQLGLLIDVVRPVSLRQILSESMEADAASRYRSRILREMNANRDNPFNSPPSSTGSHGTVSPTLSSVFSDPDGESTRRLNEDIARVTAPRKLPVNWEAAHRKWPEFFGMPKSRDAPIFDEPIDTRHFSAESKENKVPAPAKKYIDDSTIDSTWLGSKKTRAEMQPRADNESDLSSILSHSPGRGLSHAPLAKGPSNPSPLAKVQTRVPSDTMSHQQSQQRRGSISDALDRLRNASRSPKDSQQRDAAPDRHSPMSSAKSSLTAVPSPSNSVISPSHNETNARSFFMPDVSHLGDFVTGTLRFSGSMRNGVPILVKNGRVHDRQEKPLVTSHAQVEGFELPEDEEKIFVSMDMIRKEILSLQEHYDKVQDYAENLQRQVEQLETQLKSRKHSDGGFSSQKVTEELMAQKNRLEVEVATLQSRLEQASRKSSLNEIENDALCQEKDRAVRKLQEACEDINKLTRKLSGKQKELETTHKQLESTEHVRQENDTLRQDMLSLKKGRDASEAEKSTLKQENKALRQGQDDLKVEVESLRSDNNTIRREHQSLVSENRSLRATNKSLMEDNEDLRENLDGVQHELDAAREEVETLQQEIQSRSQEKSTLREDNDSLVRHNEKYFSENKLLRRENSSFERSLHELHEDNTKLKEEVEFLKQQLDHCRPVPKEDFSAQLDEETEENMTSAFFIPDITMNTNESGLAENTETRDVPDLTGQSTNLPTIPDITEQETRNTTKRENTSHSEKRDAQQKSRNKSKSLSTKSQGPAQNQKVAFSIPKKSSSKSASNMANKGSKRSNTAQRSYNGSSKGHSFPEMDPFNEDTTGLQSMDNTTQDQSMQLDVMPKSRKEGTAKEKKQSTIHENTSTSQKSQHTRSQSRTSQRQTVVVDATADSIKTVSKDTCPALSDDARRVLDGLCEHNCRNCIVCSRITSHRGVLSSADVASGKKRVTVSRPIPVTDRDLSVEDPTMRPAQHPGHALALVIKGLEDESHHLQLELSRIQGQYNSSDKSLGRRERLSLAENIRTLLKRLEVKNDQIYSLYDVLEGQKAAGQAMTEEEMEMTVLNITGMTVRDVTSGSDQLTWEGIQAA
ncbi:hypothetical protein G7046_g2780 [Stylonectria norvegica]|nr:hypothetical protein G7046_g2780 [Stylonectria norvegica]